MYMDVLIVFPRLFIEQVHPSLLKLTSSIYMPKNIGNHYFYEGFIFMTFCQPQNKLTFINKRKCPSSHY